MHFVKDLFISCWHFGLFFKMFDELVFGIFSDTVKTLINEWINLQIIKIAFLLILIYIVLSIYNILHVHVCYELNRWHKQMYGVDLCKNSLNLFYLEQDHFPTATFVVGICVSTVVVSAFLWITQRRKVKKH